MPNGFKWEDVEHTIELPHIYDGWSIAVLKDGTMVNRWEGQEGYEHRARLTQDHIDHLNSKTSELVEEESDDEPA